MLLIRPLLRANKPRQNKAHIVVFFIFIVSNCGGLLTPLGDPPLFLGFLSGVPFLWTFGLWKHWLLVNGLLLLIFNIYDQIVFDKEEKERPGSQLEEVQVHEPMGISGGFNLLLLLGVVLTIYASGQGIGNGGFKWSTGIAEAILAILGAFVGLINFHLSLVREIHVLESVIVCEEDPRSHRMRGSSAAASALSTRRSIQYKTSAKGTARLLDIDLSGGVSRFRVEIRDRKLNKTVSLPDLMMPMPGHHNALNATAAIAVAYELGMPADAIRKALASFGGVKRRFTKTGDWNGVQIFDDYGHHPVEIAAVLRAARASTKDKVIAVMQPHRYTRLHSLFNDFATCFNDADSVIIAPVYAAGEQPIAGVDRDSLVAAIKAHGHRHVMPLEAPDKLAGMIRDIAKPGDYVVCLGAGTITQWAYALPGELAAKA